MSFNQFSFPDVQAQLQLKLRETHLFPDLKPLAIQAEFQARIEDGTVVALSTSTEKAKSEFIIAPILLEMRRLLNHSFGLFSGVELNVDAERGLNGVCDFLLTKEAAHFVLAAPLVAIVEAKNDNLRSGLGQCIASMVAAQLYNEQKQKPLAAVFGVVTTGSAWKFLKLEKQSLTIDLQEYYVDNLGRLLAVFKHILQQP